MGYRRMLFIGLGGSGGKALRFLKRDFTEWCKLNGWFDEKRLSGVERNKKADLPFGVQFLNIDTPAIQDGRIAGAPFLADREYRGLVSRGLNMKSLMQQVDMTDQAGTSLVGWRVNPRTRVNLEDGAGQYRAIGRSLSRAYAASIHSALTKAIDAVDGDRAREEMRELDELVHGPQHGGVTDDLTSKGPVTVFLSSLAGGTGAGMISEVLDIYRSLEPSYHGNTLGIWFTPDAFPPAYGSGLRPNALAAISEILNGAWWFPIDQSTSAPGVTVPVRDTSVIDSIVGLPNTIDASGVYLNYLVGQTNIEGVTLDADDRLFEKVGGALLSWVVDKDLQRDLGKVWENLAANSEVERVDLPWNYGTTSASPGPTGPPVFDALGFSRVSLGTRYFRQYAVERLTRRIVKHLARVHLESDWAQAEREACGLANEAQGTDFIVRRRYASLREVLDVQDALSDGERRTLMLQQRGDSENDEKLAQRLVDLVEKALVPETLFRVRDAEIQKVFAYASNSAPMPVHEWERILVPLIDVEVRESLRLIVMEDLPDQIRKWAEAAAQRTVVQAERAIGDYGLAVTQGMLEVFSLEIRDLVLPALKELEESSRLTSSATEVRSVFIDRLGGTFADSHKVAAEDTAEAIKYAVRAVAFGAVALVLSDAAKLIDRYRTGILRPLVAQIGQAVTSLDANFSDLDTFPDYSDSAAPPTRLMPPKSESTVVENAEFGGIFRSLLEETYRGRKADDEVVRELASGSFVREKLERMATDDPFRLDFDRAQLITVEREWSVGFDLVGGQSAAAPASVVVRATIDEVLNRSTLWVKRPKEPFGRFIDLDLRTYTEGHPDRQQRVLAKLAEAIATAQPLVQLYADTIGTFYPKKMLNEAQRVRFSITKVPFKNSTIEDDVYNLLRHRVFANEVDEATQSIKIESVLTDAADLPYVDVVSWLATPVSPVVVQTLMNPLVESWSQAKENADGRKQYWEMRRARPLGEFIPLPQPQLIAALRGWFTGRLLGLIKVDLRKQDVQILGGYHTVDPRWVAFPSPQLSSITSNRPEEDTPDLCARVLESLSLAIAFAKRTENSSLRPYLELIKLGMTDPSDRDKEVFEYAQPHPAICDWIDFGHNEPHSSQSGWDVVPAVDPVQRKQQLVDLFTENRAEFQADFERYFSVEVAHSRDKLNLPPLWPGLYWQIDAAHEMLTVGIRNYRVGSSSGTQSKQQGPRG